MLFNLYTIDGGDAHINLSNMDIREAMEQGDHVRRMVDLLVNDSLAVSVEIDYGDGSGHRLTCKEE